MKINKQQHEELCHLLATSLYAVMNPPPVGEEATPDAMHDWRAAVMDAYRVEGTLYSRVQYLIASIQQILEGGDGQNFPPISPLMETMQDLLKQAGRKTVIPEDHFKMDASNGGDWKPGDRVTWSPGLLGSSIPATVMEKIPFNDAGDYTYQIRLDHVADKPDSKPGPLIDVTPDGGNGTLTNVQE